MAAASVIAGLEEIPSEAAAKESRFNVLRSEFSRCLHFNFLLQLVFTSTKSVETNHCRQTELKPHIYEK